MVLYRHPKHALPGLLLGVVCAGAALVAAASGCSDDAGSSSQDGGVDGARDTILDAAPGGDEASADAMGDGGPTRAPFGLDSRPNNTTCRLARPPASHAEVVFDEVLTGSVLGIGPVQLSQPPGDKTRWIIGTRNGRLLSVPVTGGAPTELMTLEGVSGFACDYTAEAGFLGFAIHPSFQQNGKIFVSWTTVGAAPGFAMRSRVGCVTTPDHGASYTSVLEFDQPYGYHVGGSAVFGKDGKLYLSFGDGATYFGQAESGFFAKILRVDVDNPAPGKGYAIPPDNPFATSTVIEPATFARGFRNPFRFSFDRETGELWAGDVGHATWEEIDRVASGGNYGWPCREGAHNYTGKDPTYCPLGVTNLVEPVAEVQHVAPSSTSRSITGGVVYRGTAIPSLIGAYIFADFATGEIFALETNTITGAPEIRVLNPVGPTGGWVQIAEDLDGEMYAVDLFGHVYKIVKAPDIDAGVPSPLFPERLSQTGCVDARAPTKPASGLVPFDVNVELWSDGSEKERYLAIPDGTTLSVDAIGDVQLPRGGVLMKTFKLAGKPIETRLLVHHDDDIWQGYTYEWLDDQSDALLLPSSKQKMIGDHAWYFPSRADCLRCHTEAAGRSLGLELRQLDRDVVYAATNRVANQIATLEHLGLFASSATPLPQPAALPSLESAAPLDARARAYLHVNCAGCHRPNGGAASAMDLRYERTLAETNACNATPAQGDFHVTGATLLTPGASERSLISLRPKALGSGRMPPLGTARVDQQGLALVDAWITSLIGCP